MRKRFFISLLVSAAATHTGMAATGMAANCVAANCVAASGMAATGVTATGVTARSVATLHADSLSASRISVEDERITVSLISQGLSWLEVLGDLDPDGDGSVTPRDLEQQRSAMAAYLADHYRLSAGTHRLKGELDTLALEVAEEASIFGPARELILIELIFPRPQSLAELTVEVDLFLKDSPRHRDFNEILWDGRRHGDAQFNWDKRQVSFSAPLGAGAAASTELATGPNKNGQPQTQGSANDLSQARSYAGDDGGAQSASDDGGARNASDGGGARSASGDGETRSAGDDGGTQRLSDGGVTRSASGEHGTGHSETGLAAFLGMGIEHILSGWDHLAFLLALFLSAYSLRSVFILVTAFSAAHSLTLALAALEWISLPSGLVECAIALSIALVAAENIFLGGGRSRWIEAFGFGLLHGLGFAGFLGGTLSALGAGGDAQAPSLIAPLIGFNLGVELGQLAVALALLPLLCLAPGTRTGGAGRMPETVENGAAPGTDGAVGAGNARGAAGTGGALAPDWLRRGGSWILLGLGLALAAGRLF
ncbi:MAG: HupE/UreJ family protein [Planctomycetota bacterium]|nr:HupE/UreJ family protein [Planctomycetota bacterium]